MKLFSAVAFALTVTSVAAHAYFPNVTIDYRYPAYQTGSIYYPVGSHWIRSATINNWAGKAAFVPYDAYKYSGITYGAYVNTTGNSQFKFDLSATGNWTPNYGDNNTANACLDANGANINLNQGAGTYFITYSTGSVLEQPYSTCGANKPYYSVTKLNAFSANVRTMYLRTSFNSWGSLPMVLLKNNVWEAEVSGARNTFGSMKFDSFGDWTANLGLPLGSSPREGTNTGVASVANGVNIPLYMEDYSSDTVVKGIIRFNSSTKEYKLCAVRSSSNPNAVASQNPAAICQ